jgi:hypothetical protein
MKTENEEQPHERRNGTLKYGNPPCDLSLLPRCNATAKTTGMRCKQVAMKNGKCHWHGGASTGAPSGNKNALKHGRYTKESLDQQKFFRRLLRESRETLTGL